MNHDAGDDPPDLFLHGFLREQHEAILRDWERADRRYRSARHLDSEELRNNIPSLLEALADQAEQIQKGRKKFRVPKASARKHAEHRWNLGFSLEEVTREYGLLRRIILEKLVPRVGELPAGELVLLNEGLDQAIVDGVVTYVAKANQVLDAERQRLRVTLQSIGEGVVSTDAHGRVVYINPTAEALCGWSREQALGRQVGEVLAVVDAQTGEPMEGLIREAVDSSAIVRHPREVLLKRRDGEQLPIEEAVSALRGDQGELLGVVSTFRDVSELRALTTQLYHLASHDALTELPNRALLRERVEQALVRAERHGDRFAVLYLDLDHFKHINDTLGHSAGDRLLKEVARRLEQCVRRTDTVARLGGDEFAVLLSEFKDSAWLYEIGEEVVRALRQPYHIDSHTFNLSTSVGISVYPEDGRDPEKLIKHADIAMYKAKERGRNNVQYFVPEMNKRSADRRRLEGDLRRALESGQLQLYYQPQMDLRSGRLVGAEALLRWRNTRRRLVSPRRFIPVAEECGLIVPIGEWVLEEACRQVTAWRAAGFTDLRLSVNVSPVQLRHERFMEHITELVERCSVPPGQLELELTESIIMSDIAGATGRVRRLKELGLRISVDDFGTGYSSLSYLKELPVDELKIDQSFVRYLGEDENDGAIVQAVIGMGRSLKLRVVAEGVEDREALDFLRGQGCEAAQGYYYSKPLPSEAFARRFLSGNA